MNEREMNPQQYEAAAAIITHATLSVGIQRSFPDMSLEERDTLFVSIIDRLARMRGFKIDAGTTRQNQSAGG